MKRFHLSKATGYSKLALPHLMLKLSFSLFLICVCCVGELWAQPSLSKVGWTMVFNEEFETSAFLTNGEWDLTSTPADPVQDGNLISSALVSHLPSFQYAVNGLVKQANGCAVLGNRRLQNLPHLQHRFGNGTTIDVLYEMGNLRSTFDEYNYHGMTFPLNNRWNQPCFGEANRPGGYLYGMFEIRRKAPNDKGQYPTLWITGNNSQTEDDIFENAEAFSDTEGERLRDVFCTTHTDDWNNINAQGRPERVHCSNYYRLHESMANDFHTWTLVWTPFETTWFLDGVELKTHKYRPLTTPFVRASEYDVNRRDASGNLICVSEPAWSQWWTQSDLMISNSMYCPNFDPLTGQRWINHTDFWKA